MTVKKNDITALAFDLGATSGRAILGSLRDGKLELEEVHRFPNESVRYNGELHWDAPRLWHEIQTGLQKAAEPGQPITSIGVDTWGVDYALLGEKGALLDNPHHYRDQRTQGMLEEVCGKIGADRIYDVTGIQFMSLNSLYQLYAASKRTPGLLKGAEALLTMPDLLNYWLSGVMGCEYTNATTTQFMDRRTRGWAADLLSDLGIPTHFLREIIQPGTTLGPLRGELKHSDALKSAKVIAPACHDTGSAVAAVPTGGDTAFLSSGTWSLLGTEIQEAIVNEDSRRLNFTNEGGVGGTFRLLKNITGMWLLESCRKAWTDSGHPYSYADLMKMAESAEPLRSLFDPAHDSFTAPGHMPQAIDSYCTRTGQPKPESPGGYTRAILESLALKYRQTLEQMSTVTGVQFRTLRVFGGGCRNSMLNQYTADASGCRILAGPAEATALGNVAMQLIGSGALGSIGEARRLIENSFPVETFEPSGAGRWDAAYRSFRSLAEAAR
jgi:rhamnulokinase